MDYPRHTKTGRPLIVPCLPGRWHLNSSRVACLAPTVARDHAGQLSCPPQTLPGAFVGDQRPLRLRSHLDVRVAPGTRGAATVQASVGVQQGSFCWLGRVAGALGGRWVNCSGSSIFGAGQSPPLPGPPDGSYGPGLRRGPVPRSARDLAVAGRGAGWALGRKRGAGSSTQPAISGGWPRGFRLRAVRRSSTASWPVARPPVRL
jgi:hypothetical protein